MQALQQQRAAFALNQVKAVPVSEREDFKRQAESFPAMIRMNGLGQAAAFYLSKGGAHDRLYKLLSDWLAEPRQPYEGKDLLKGITETDMHAYRLAQAEALLLLDWVKKFAKAFVEDDKQPNHEPENQP